jgi:CheY-like chemotaxis protein
MSKPGPIIIVEDDRDDEEMLKEVFQELMIPNEIKFFRTCYSLLDYLLVTTDQPFIIISDINLPVMSGVELKKKINENEYLRKKSIPFVFLTTSSNAYAVEQAYEMMVQGYFVKPNTVNGIKEMVGLIIDYWKRCRHPNTK